MMSLKIISLLILSFSICFTQDLNLSSGFTQDFLNFLNEESYGNLNFDRTDIEDACYGGADSRPTAPPQKPPVIFVHGNSDIGFGQGGKVSWQTGARVLFQFLSANGYSKKDLYVTTWGDGDSKTPYNKYHSKQILKYNRAFVEAVLKYTKSSSVVIIGHSMGVTIGRKIIKGGSSFDEASYDLETPLTDRVGLFIGLAGANQGLVDCVSISYLPTCGTVNGFFPGNPLTQPSKSVFLEELDSNPAREGRIVVSLWSHSDDIIKYDNLVYGKYTSRIKNQDDEIQYTFKGHFGVRDETAQDILRLIKKYT